MSGENPGINIAKYQTVQWQGITDYGTQAAVRDVAQKLEGLARDVAPGLMLPGGLAMYVGRDTCPPGWELVVEFDGRVPMGTLPANNDTGTTGGSNTHNHAMPHTHTIPEQAAATTDSQGAHTHTISSEADHNHTMGRTAGTADEGDGTFGSFGYIDTLDAVTGNAGGHNHGGATGSNGAHTHTVPAHGHGGNTGAVSTPNTADTTQEPAHVKVIFCRRVR